MVDIIAHVFPMAVKRPVSFLVVYFVMLSDNSKLVLACLAGS